MPKQILKDVQDLRKSHKEKLRKYPVSTVYLQVIGSGATGAGRSLYVFTEHCRYLFNCGEGTQRLAYEHKIKLTMTEHVLITAKTWENVGGLPGVLLTLQDSGVPDISIHGPPGIESLCYDTSNFMRLGNLVVNCCHYKKEVHDEGPLNIKYVPIWPQKEANGASVDEQFAINPGVIVQDLYAHEGENVSAHLSIRERSEESLNCQDLTIAYVCRPVPKLGALLPRKCKELGVPKGPLLGQLKNGKDVTLPCGKIIKASDVTAPDDPGPVFIVLEIPTVSHLESLVMSNHFQNYQSETAKRIDDVAQIVVHFTPSHVAQDPRYRRWCDSFAPETTHVYINEDNRCLGSERVHKIQHKLNHLYAPSFPLLHDSSIPLLLNPHEVNGCDEKRVKCDNSFSANNSHSSIETSPVSNIDANHRRASTLFTYHIRPHSRIENRSISLDPETYVRECYDEPAFELLFKDVQDKVKRISESLATELQHREYPIISFLGTGSCIPNKTRNTSGISLSISATSSMILDCGEGTYGQLIRLYGLESTDEFIRNLKAIYVSHLHADHHIGLIRLLLARKKVFQDLQIPIPKLYLLAPSAIIVYLVSYHSNFQPITDTFTLVPNHNFNSTNRQACNFGLIDDENIQIILDHLQIKSLSTCLVHHCPDAYGMTLTLKDGWKMVYSGDTMPSPSLETIGLGCDLLIHEATMEDDLLEDAKLKRHSTTSGALQSGSVMGAKFIILTHFSQRYAKVPLIQQVPPNVAVAFDNMKVRLKDLPCLPALYPAFVSMFSQDYDLMVEKTRKRKARDQQK